ncbi:MAG: hypothetical protein KGJ02_05685 [Verrucomicrobiota bacterium]|nr:hypothetical protein [Verrucomicrobiota bacterium]
MNLLNDLAAPEKAAEKAEKFVQICRQKAIYISDPFFWEAVCAFAQGNTDQMKVKFAAMVTPDSLYVRYDHPFKSTIPHHLHLISLKKLNGTERLVTKLWVYVLDHPEVLPVIPKKQTLEDPSQKV